MKFEPFALSLVSPELAEGSKGFDRLNSNGTSYLIDPDQ